MSDAVIKSGTGNGASAKVDGFNRLSTVADIREEIRTASARGNAYLLATPKFSVTAGIAYPLLRLSILSQYFFFSRVICSYNGGNTNHNRTGQVSMYIGMPAPTANNTAYTPKNLLTSNLTPADGTFDMWDGANNGMTVAANGLYVASLLAGQGVTDVDFRNSLILTPGQSIGFVFTPEEDGDVTLTVTGFYQDLEV